MRQDVPVKCLVELPNYRPEQVILTDRELEVIRRIQAGAFPHPEFEAYPDYVDYFTHEKEIMPLEGGDEPKRRFVPSKVPCNGFLDGGCEQSTTPSTIPSVTFVAYIGLIGWLPVFTGFLSFLVGIRRVGV